MSSAKAVNDQDIVVTPAHKQGPSTMHYIVTDIFSSYTAFVACLKKIRLPSPLPNLHHKLLCLQPGVTSISLSILI